MKDYLRRDEGSSNFSSSNLLVIFQPAFIKLQTVCFYCRLFEDTGATCQVWFHISGRMCVPVLFSLVRYEPTADY